MASPRIVIRRATAEDVPAIAAVHVRSWQSSYRALIPQDFLDHLSVERRAESWQRALTETGQALFVGLLPDERVGGFCAAGPNRGAPSHFTGEVYAIYLLEEAKRQGLGRALFLEASGWLRSQGHGSLLVWVLAGNEAARSFYLALGGTLAGAKVTEIDGLQYDEVGYGWEAERPPR